MITVVFDTNAIVSSIFWPRSTSRRCLAGLARRQYGIAASLAWLRLKAHWVESAQLGKQRSRDAKDDPFLACALAARAKYVVTRDDDLLVLGKPFGIEMITPANFLAWLREHNRHAA